MNRARLGGHPLPSDAEHVPQFLCWTTLADWLNL